MNYQQQAVAGMNPVELIVSLYDGMVRFLYRAIAAIERDDQAERRVAVKRVLDILMYLQSRLRTDVGGNSAKSLSEFYAAIFALCLEGSRLASADRLKEAIACARDVREAWHVASQDPEVLRVLGCQQPSVPAPLSAIRVTGQTPSASWTA